MDTQLKKGVLEMCVLIRLSRQDMYGYEIMKLIQDVFPEVYDGSIYTILRRIRGEGYTETYMKDVPSGVLPGSITESLLPEKITVKSSLPSGRK